MMGNETKEKQFFDMARETMDWEKRKADLNLKFLNIFHHAYKHSKAYQQSLRSASIEPSQIRSLEDLETLPILRINDLVGRAEKPPSFRRI